MQLSEGTWPIWYSASDAFVRSSYLL